MHAETSVQSACFGRRGAGTASSAGCQMQGWRLPLHTSTAQRRADPPLIIIPSCRHVHVQGRLAAGWRLWRIPFSGGSRSHRRQLNRAGVWAQPRAVLWARHFSRAAA